MVNQNTQTSGLRRALLSLAIVLWIGLFHYESLRLLYLGPWLGAEKPLPKFPLLFPPAGWIMFYQVSPSFGCAEVYTVQGGKAELMDWHDIFRTRAIGYDNLRRNVAVNVLDETRAPLFCAYLERRFPETEAFVIAYRQYGDLAGDPKRAQRRTVYRCQGRRQ